MWSDERGQAFVEFALGLPLFLLATLYAFALVDAALTQAAATAGATRAATAIASTNDDAIGLQASAGFGWLRGQELALVVVPPARTCRSVGARVTVELAAPGHLSFLMPVTTRWNGSATAFIENSSAIPCVPRP